MTGALLDTTVLIDLSRGNLAAADFVDAAFKAETPFTAITNGLELATDNDHHFKMISELTVKRPY